MVVKVSTLLAVFFLALAGGNAQKIVKKTLINPESRAFQIDALNCFEVQIGTSRTNEIVIAASIEGEYQKDLLVNVEEEGSNVMISAGFQPNFKNPNDKLSAHKVISIALAISLPENTDVAIFGTTANVIAEGLYKRMSISLSDGDCRMANIGETVQVTTQKGNIFLAAPAGQVDAQSNYGKVLGDSIPMGNSTFRLQAIEGNIHLKRTE